VIVDKGGEKNHKDIEKSQRYCQEGKRYNKGERKVIKILSRWKKI
jgi:hypothetical protein